MNSKDVNRMNTEGKSRKLSDLIISWGGMIIVALGIGLMLWISYMFKSTACDYANLIGAGSAILFMIIAFALYYETVNKKTGNSSKN